MTPAVAVGAAVAVLLAAGAVPAQEVSPASPTGAVGEAPAGLVSRVTPRGDRARLGLFLRMDCETDSGADGECSMPPVVSSVVEDAPAAESGIQPGDTLIALDGVSLRTERGRRALSALRAGVPVRLEVGRRDGRRQLDVTPEPRPLAGLFDVTVESGAWWPRETAEVRVFRFRNEAGGTAEFYFAPAPKAPPAPEGFVVFGEDEAGELRLKTGPPGVALRTPDGRRIELNELERRATDGAGLNVEVESVEEGDGGVRHRVVLKNAELAQRLESVREDVLERARLRIDSLRRRQAELALRGDLPPAAAAGYVYRVRPDESTEVTVRSAAPPSARREFRYSGIAPDHRLAGAEFRLLTPELAEYFPVDAGLLVLRVIPGTPANALGLRGGDVVVEIGGRNVLDVNVFRRLISESLAAGEPLEVKWNRKGTEMAGRLTAE